MTQQQDILPKSAASLTRHPVWAITIREIDVHYPQPVIVLRVLNAFRGLADAGTDMQPLPHFFGNSGDQALIDRVVFDEQN